MLNTKLKTGPVIDINFSTYFPTELQVSGLKTIMEIEELKRDIFDDNEMGKDTERIYG